MRALENLGIVEEAPEPVQRRQPPPPPEPQPSLSTTASIDKRRKALARKKAQRKNLTHKAATPPDEPTGPIVTTDQLADPETARMAMIYHEIFSPCKALRNTPDIWDA